jgi:hypothetical protein
MALRMPKKIPSIILTCTILIILILIFTGSLVAPAGTFIGGIDVPGYFYWNLAFVQDTIRAGVIPLWNPHYYSGHPFLANPSTFVFYPATLLYVLLPLPWAFNLDTLIHLFMASLGMFYLVRLITGSHKAGFASAIVFSLNGYFIERIFGGHITLIHAAALIPWVFFFIEKAMLSKSKGLFVLSGVVLGMQILGGDPQVSFYTALFSSMYFFLRLVVDLKPLQPAVLLKTCGYFLLYPFTAFCVSAVQILPSIEFKAFSERGQNTYDFATFMSFSPEQFFSFLIPKASSPTFNTNWEFGCYLGILALVVAGIGGLFYQNRKYVLCYAVLLAAALTFMLGSFTPLYYLYFKYIPVITTFRVPARSIVIFDFILSIFVGFGIHYLHESGLKLARYGISMLVAALLSIGIYVGVVTFQVPPASKELITAISIIAGTLVLLSLIFIMKNRTPVIWLIIAVLFADLYLVYSDSVPHLNSNELLQKQSYELVFEKDTSLYRVNVPGYRSEFYGLPARGMKYQYYGINGNTPIILKDYFNFIYSMADVPMPEMFRHTFIPELFSPNLAFSSRILGLKYAIVETSGGYKIMSAEKYQQRALILRDMIFTPSYEDHLQILKNPDFDPQKKVLLEDSARSAVTKIGQPDAMVQDTVDIEHYSPNRLVLRADCTEGGILLLSELYYPGWKAYVDGTSVQILRADYLLRAIPLGPGKHSIEVVYRPMSFLVGSAVSLSALLLLLFLWIAKRYTTRIDSNKMLPKGSKKKAATSVQNGTKR